MEYPPLDECTCGRLKKLLEFLDAKFVMIFIMGLDESHAQFVLKFS